MNYKKLGFLSLCVLLVIGLNSCGSEKKSDEAENADEFEQAESGIKDQIQEVVYEIPSPSEDMKEKEFLLLPHEALGQILYL